MCAPCGPLAGRDRRDRPRGGGGGNRYGTDQRGERPFMGALPATMPSHLCVLILFFSPPSKDPVPCPLCSRAFFCGRHGPAPRPRPRTLSLSCLELWATRAAACVIWDACHGPRLCCTHHPVILLSAVRSWDLTVTLDGAPTGLLLRSTHHPLISLLLRRLLWLLLLCRHGQSQEGERRGGRAHAGGQGPCAPTEHRRTPGMPARGAGDPSVCLLYAC